jgi:hypothetical protein
MTSTRWKIALGAALLTLCSYAAIGQSGPPDGPPGPPPDGQNPAGTEHRLDPARELSRLTHLLTLNPDQQTGVKTLLEQQTQQMKALRGKAQVDPSSGQAPETRQARMTQMEQIRDETDTKIAALLDTNQKKTFADWVQQRKEASGRRRSRQGDQGTPPPPPPDGAADRT